MSRRRCCCHVCTANITLAEYENMTRVPGSPDPIAPEPRSTSYTLEERLALAEECEGTFDNWNCYVATGDTVTRTFDVKGMKLVQSNKAVRGRKGFTSICPADCAAVFPRYLSVDMYAYFNAYTEVSGAYFSEYDGVVTEDANKGCSSATGTQDATDDIGATGYTKEELEYFAQELARIRTTCVDIAGTPTVIFVGLDYTALPGGALRAAREYAYNVCQWLNYDLTSGAVGSDPSAVGVTVGDYSIGDLVIYGETDYDDGFGGTIHAEFRIELPEASEYTADDVRDAAIACAAFWSLANNNYLPWRQDGLRNTAPICRYHEVQGLVELADAAPTLPYTEDCLTGVIIGKPFTLGWPDHSFDYDHENWTYSGSWTHATDFYGQYTYIAWASGIIPPTARIWTSNYLSCNELFRPGYGWFYDPSGVLWLQKGEEVLEQFESFNFFRMDRWLQDTGVYSDGTSATTSSGIDNVSGSVLTTNIDLTAAFGGGTKLVSITGPGVDLDGEIWYAHASATNEITLDSQLVTDSGEWAYLKALVQAAYTAAGWTISQGDYGRVGILRFQYDRSGTQWPMKVGIAGRVAVTASYNSGTGKTTFTLASSQQLITGDIVDALASNYSTVIGSAISVTWVDETTFTATGDYTGTAWLRSTGAPHYLWNDNSRYGDFVVQSTTTSVVDDALVETCVNSDANGGTGQCPIVACTPNADASSGATSIAWPDAPAMYQCGGRAWKYVVQNMVDPVWQEPISTAESYTGCPHYVEARVTVRSGTRGGETCPPLPANCAFTVPATSPGNPGNGGSSVPVASYTPWGDSCV